MCLWAPWATLGMKDVRQLGQGGREVSLDPRGFCHRPTDGPPKDGFLGLGHVGWAHLSEPSACEKFWSQSQQNCHFHCLVTKSCLTLCDLMDCRPPGSSVHGISQASPEVGSHFLLQGILPTQGSNPGLLN